MADMAAPGKPSTLALAALFGALSVLGLATGAAVGLALKGNGGEPAAEAAAAEPPAAESRAPDHAPSAPAVAEDLAPPLLDDQAGPVAVVPFPPVLTNLAEPSGTWIRLEGSLVLDGEAEDPQAVLVEHAAEQILTFVRTVALADIEGPSGFLSFRSDLDELVSQLSKGQVKNVILHAMVVE